MRPQDGVLEGPRTGQRLVVVQRPNEPTTGLLQSLTSAFEAFTIYDFDILPLFHFAKRCSSPCQVYLLKLGIHTDHLSFPQLGAGHRGQYCWCLQSASRLSACEYWEYTPSKGYSLPVQKKAYKSPAPEIRLLVSSLFSDFSLKYKALLMK